MRLIVVIVLEVGGIGVTKKEWHEGVSIIDGVEFLAVEEVLHVVLDDRALVDGSSHGSGGVHADAVTKGENVLKSSVLKSIWVNVNNTFSVCDA
jgi:hypothetical protein